MSTLQKPSVATVLQALTRQRLIAFGRDFKLGVSPTLAKPQQIAALTRSGSIRLAELLRCLTRACYTVATDQGLIQTNNRLKDPACDEPEIVELRRLHEEMDRAVLGTFWPLAPRREAIRENRGSSS